MPISHIVMQVGATAYPITIDPLSYSEVDIVDFAPRAVSGTPAFSELGLYLDIAQFSFRHGFGKWRFEEEASYAYTGDRVDTRHGFAQLYTVPTVVFNIAGRVVNEFILHRGVPILACNTGLYVLNTALAIATVTAAWEARHVLSNGKYFFVTRAGRMQVADCGNVNASTPNSITIAPSPAWTVNLFQGGTVVIYEGTGSPQSVAVVSNTVDTIVVGAWGVQPDNTSKFVVFDDAGVGGNPPNDFNRLMLQGGYAWASEYAASIMHFWAMEDGTDAEGGGMVDTDAVRVGPGVVPIINLGSSSNQLWVMRADGAWYIGDDNVAYHMLDFTDQISTLNFATFAVWNGFTFFPVRNALYKYKSGLQDVTPPRWSEDIPYKEFGNFKGLTPRGKFLYVIGSSNWNNATDEPTEATGFAALMATDGVGWHKVLDLPYAAPTYCNTWLDPLNDRLYYFCYSGGNGKLDYIQLQTLSDLPYGAYPTTGDHRLYLSYLDLGMRRIYKSLATLIIDGDIPTVCSVIADYRRDATAAWTNLGTFLNPMQALAFPVGTTCMRGQFRFNLQTTNAAYTPIIKAVILKCMLRPSVLYGATFDCIVDDNLLRPDSGALGLTSAKQVRAALKAARNSVGPITFTNLWGESAAAYLSSLRFVTVGYGDERVANVARCTVVYV